MEIVTAEMFLAQAGLRPPVLRPLLSTADNYSALLMQPEANIDVSHGVHSYDPASAATQFEAFLRLAAERDAGIAITPEYSMPWDVLTGALAKGVTPSNGALWVLGCESIRYGELEALRAELAPTAVMMFEPLERDDARFADPLTYVFWTESAETGIPTLVLLVQFKTCPMGDHDHFERNALQCGSRIYQFGGSADTVRLLSLICSDAFAFNQQHAEDVYDRALVIHLQLNPNPRQTQFRAYREQLLKTRNDETEIVCLNWAASVCVWRDGNKTEWHNPSLSAWYLRPAEFDHTDEQLIKNHRRGLYYTRLTPQHTHALFFNFSSAVFELNATKVFHHGVPAPLSRRRGPQLATTFRWYDNAWTATEEVDDGFEREVEELAEAAPILLSEAALNPLGLERMLALSAGAVNSREDWHDVMQLDSCAIDATEIIRRITFCQDADAREFRSARLSRFRRLMRIVAAGVDLPSPLKDLQTGSRFGWVANSPHQNIRSADGRAATVIYLGEDTSESTRSSVKKRVAEFLHRSKATPDESLLAQQRLVVFYRNDAGDVAVFDPDEYLMIDKVDQSEFDIARES